MVCLGGYMQYLSEEIYDEDNDDTLIGSFEGYVVNKNEENWKNFLKKEVSESKVADFLIDRIENSNATTVAILRNINVEEEYKGNGYGNKLMSLFIESAGNNGADIFLLVADKMESQNEGFDLRNWYEGYGYEQVFDEEDVTLMIWDVANNLTLENKTLKEEVAEHLTASATSKFKP